MLGQILPACAAARHPDNSLKASPLVCRLLAALARHGILRKIRLYQAPLLVGELVANTILALIHVRPSNGLWISL
jgi:membrane associated rhomboid family serine protease